MSTTGTALSTVPRAQSAIVTDLTKLLTEMAARALLNGVPCNTGDDLHAVLDYFMGVPTVAGADNLINIVYNAKATRIAFIGQ